MSERQREAHERMEAALQSIPENKLEYVLGYADAMADAKRKKEAKEADEETEEEK